MIRFALPLLCVSLFQFGCILQVPLGKDQSTYPALAGDRGSAPVLQPGQTTRQQVLTQLGPPMFRWDSDVVWEYVEHPIKGFSWAFPAIFGHGSPWWTEQGTHYLMLRFSPDDTLHDYEILVHPDSGDHESELARFRNPSATTSAPTLNYGQRINYGPWPQMTM